MIPLRCRLFVSTFAVLVSASTARAQSVVQDPGSSATPSAVSRVVPVELRELIVTPAGVSVTLVNHSTQPIAGYLVGLTYSSDPDSQHFAATVSNWGAHWPPGREISMLLSPRPSDEPARVIVRAAVLADGTGYGDRETVDRIRSDWDRRRSGLSGALALLDPTTVPATEEELQTLIEGVALTMARVPVSHGGESLLQPYVQVIVGLKQLQRRDLAGTERLARELSQLAGTLRRELAAVPGVPRSVSH